MVSGRPRPAGLRAVLLLACASAAAPATAQTCHPIAGRWALDAAASQMAPGFSLDPRYRVDAVAVTVDATPAAIEESWTFRGERLAETHRYRVPIDAPPAATGAKSVLWSVPDETGATWEGCTLLERARKALFHQDLLIESRWFVTPDGRSLVIHQKTTSDMINAERRLVFTRR